MKKKRLKVFIGLGIAALGTVLIYWFYFSKPTLFPTNEVLVNEINDTFPQVSANVIQDTIPVGERHVLVPFISDKDDYGLSYWVWDKRKWRVDTIDSKGTPMIWQVDHNDPSTYHFVWNIHPDDNLSYMDFYLIRDRGFFITQGIERYYPRVQLEKRISFEKSYGAMQLPADWASIMNTTKEVDSANQSSLFNDHFFYQQYMNFGWIPYDQDGKESFPERSVNGSGYSNGNVDIEFVMTLNEELDLEAGGVP